jgi:hypothetical protein
VVNSYKTSPDLFNALTELPDGRITVAGAWSTQVSGGQYPGVRICAPDLTLLGAASVTSGSSTAVFSAITLLGDDTLGAAGMDSKNIGVVTRFSDKPALLANTEVPEAANLLGLRQRSDGSLEAWGVATGNLGVVRAIVSLAGKNVATKTLAMPTDVIWVRVARAVDGALHVLVTLMPGGAGAGKKEPGRVLLLRVDDAGNVVWQRQVGAEGRVATALTPTAAGFVVAGRTDLGGAQEEGWVAGVDTQGNLAWGKLIGGKGFDAFLAATAFEGNVVLAGLTDSKGAGSYDGWLVHTDAWGQAPCSSSGPCAKLDAKACLDDAKCTVDYCSALDGCVHGAPNCADNNACTTDACDPKVGCSWLVASDGTDCGGGKTCTGGLCLCRSFLLLVRLLVRVQNRHAGRVVELAVQLLHSLVDQHPAARVVRNRQRRQFDAVHDRQFRRQLQESHRLAAGFEAIRRLLGRRALDELAQVVGAVGAALARVRRRRAHLHVEQFIQRLSVERHVVRDELVGEDAQRIEV